MPTLSEGPSRATQRAEARKGMQGLMTRYLIAALIALHGVIHLMGFGATFQLGQIDAVSALPTLVPDTNRTGAQMLGVIWALCSLLFVVGAAGYLLRSDWWREALMSAAVASLALCVLWLRQAWAGALIDVTLVLWIASITWTGRTHAVH